MCKPKVLILGKLPPPYFGPAIATQIILNSKLNKNFTLYHLDTNVHKKLSTLGVWKFNKILKNVWLYCRFIGLIVKCWPDLVLIPISQSTLGFFKDSIFIIIGKLFGRKELLQLRGSNLKNWLDDASKMTRTYVSSIIKKTQGVIVLGEKLKYFFLDYYKDEKIFVVPNGADYDYGYTVKKNSVPNILYLSNLLPSKGIEDVLDAMIILRERYRQKFHVDIVGAWVDKLNGSRSVRNAKEKNLDLIFHSQVGLHEKNYFYKNADIFVFPPREPEGHPWVIVEAMAAGLPIISTDQGAITESVIDGINGFIVSKKNPIQIAERINLLIENPRLQKKMGENSRKFYLENFTEEKMVKRMTNVFYSVLKK